MQINRFIESHIINLIGRNKVILILGTRRVGKTFLVQQIFDRYEGKKVMLNAEDLDVQAILAKRTIANYRQLTGEASLLVIDEVQAVPEIGKALKLMIDSQPGLTIIATGSSSLDLINKAGEPLTGRQYPFLLYPIAQLELGNDPLTTRATLDERLIFGSYPEIFQLTSAAEKENYLKELIKSYLLKDILAYSGIKHSAKLIDLLRLIAYQIGSEVSSHELSLKLGMSRITVEHYLDLLQKVFILFKLTSYSTNPRREISKGAKWYFHDNGIRNAVIQDFRIPELRNDIGQLWENRIISERLKRNSYRQENSTMHFWRTYQQQEIDLVEISAGKMSAYEIKYGKERKPKIPLTFRNAYPDAEFRVIHQDDYLDFVF